MTITTSKTIDLSTTATPAATSPSSDRPTRRHWYAAVAAAAALALATAAIGYALNQSSQDVFVPFKTTNAAVTPDAAESVHGSGANLRTGTGGSLSSPTVAAGVISSSNGSADMAHGTGQKVVTTTGQAVH